MTFCNPNPEAIKMIVDPSADAKTSARFAEPPWNEHSEPWRQLDAQLPPRSSRPGDSRRHDPSRLGPLYTTYRGRGKAPHRPDLMLAIVLFELRRGKRQPSQWYPDTLETYPLWWLGFGIHPSRSCWYEFRDRAGASVDTLNTQLLHQAVEAELTTAERGALDGSAVAANASRRRLINSERLEKRLAQLEAAIEDEAHGEDPGEVPGWMAPTPHGRLHQHERYGQAQAHLATRQAANEQRPPAQRREPD